MKWGTLMNARIGLSSELAPMAHSNAQTRRLSTTEKWSGQETVEGNLGLAE